MSDSIRAGLESHLNSLTEHIEIEYENNPFTPEDGVPYMSVFMLRSDTDDLSISYDDRKRFNGIFQISLRYPTGNGSGGAETEALRIIEHFKRGTIINKNDIQIRVQQTPSMKNLGIDADRLVVVVRVVYEAYNTI